MSSLGTVQPTKPAATHIQPQVLHTHSSSSIDHGDDSKQPPSARSHGLVTQQKQVESSNSAKQPIGTLQKQADVLLKRLAKHTNWQDQALAQRVADQITRLTSTADYQGAIALLKAWLSYLQPVALQHNCMPVSRMVPLLLKDLTDPKKTDEVRQRTARSLGQYAPQLQGNQLQQVVKALCEILRNTTNHRLQWSVAEALGLCATRLPGHAQQEVIQTLIKVLRSHDKQAKRGAVARALGDCAAQLKSHIQSQVTQALCHTLEKDSDDQVRYAAGLALGSCTAQLQPQSQQQAIQVLLQVACTEKKYDAQRGALDGLSSCLAELHSDSQQRIVQALLKLLREDKDQKALWHRITEILLCEHITLLPSKGRQQVINHLLEALKNADMRRDAALYLDRCVVHLERHMQQKVAEVLLKVCREDLHKRKHSKYGHEDGSYYAFHYVHLYFSQLILKTQQQIIEYLLEALAIHVRPNYSGDKMRDDAASMLGLCAAQLSHHTRQQVGHALLKSLQSKNSAHITEALRLYTVYLESGLRKQIVQALLGELRRYDNSSMESSVARALGKYATQVKSETQQQIVQALFSLRSRYNDQNHSHIRSSLVQAFGVCVNHLEGKLQQNVVGALLTMCRSGSRSAIIALNTCLTQLKPTHQQQAVEILLNELCKNNRPFDKQCRVNFSAGRALIGYLIGLTAKEQIQFFQSNNEQLTTNSVEDQSNGWVYMTGALLWYISNTVEKPLLKLLTTSTQATSLPSSSKSKASMPLPSQHDKATLHQTDHRHTKSLPTNQNQNTDNEEKEPQPAAPSAQLAAVSLSPSKALPSQTTPHQAKDQYALGKRYAYGTQDIEQDDSLACYWLQQAAGQVYRPAMDLLQKWAKQSGDRATMAQQALQGLKMAPSSPQKPVIDEQKEASLSSITVKPLSPISSAKATGAPTVQVIKNRHINSRATRIAKQIIKQLKGSATQKSALLVALKTALIDHTTLHDWLAAKRLVLKAKDIQVLAYAIAEELKFEAVDDLLGSDGKQTLADAVDVGIEALSQRVPAQPDNPPQRRAQRNDHDNQEGYVEITHRIHSQ